MDHQSFKRTAINADKGIRGAVLPEAIGNFALGVGSVREKHVVLDIHDTGSGIADKLAGTGAKVIDVEQYRAPRATPMGSWRVLRTDGSAAASASPVRLDPGSVDIVFMELALGHMGPPSMTIAAIKRILKPGGRLVITDLARGAQRKGRDQHGRQKNGYYPGDIRHWLKIAGFSNIIVNPVPAASRPAGSACPVEPEQTGYLMATGTA